MTEEQTKVLVRTAQAVTGTTQKEVAELIGYSHRTIAGAACGERPLPRPAVLLLRLVAGGQVSREHLEAAR